MSIIKTTPIISEKGDDNLLSYIFNVPSENFATAGNYDTIIYANESVTFESSDFIKNIYEWKSISDTITGDTSFFEIIRFFRYSITGNDFSEWIPLNIENLQTFVGANMQISIQYNYIAVPLQQNYNLSITVPKPDIDGWYNIPYKFITDYPLDGTLSWNIGYGTNGQYHIDTDTSKFYVKSNGVWMGGVYVVREENGTYIPTEFNGQLLTDNFTNSIHSRHGFIPINDYVLTNDLMFGTNIDNSQTSNIYRPKNGDTLFFNPLIQGIKLNGLEVIQSSYSYPIFPPSYIPKVYVKELNIICKQYINTVDGDSVFCLNNVGDQTILKPLFLLKVYRLDYFYVNIDGKCSTSWNTNLDIKFRYSFNSRRWENDWMPLTQSNIKCIKGTPIKFFYIEFLFTKIGYNNGYPICIYDVILNGDMQNITNDYQKLNRFGLRGDCNYTETTYNPMTGECGADNPCSSNNAIALNWSTDVGACGVKLPTYNPYNSTQLIAFNEKLALDVSNLFGWEVDYYKTEANDAGIDVVLHEYGTYDTVRKEKIKILVPDNKFPEDQIAFNEFDLFMFDSFEINIVKSVFHNIFGIGTRPANKDFIFICQINKYFEVSHAQSYREFMNASIYYKVTLTKKNDDKNINNREYSTELENIFVDNMQQNLFGDVVKSEVDNVVNIDDLQNLSEINKTPHIFEYDSNIDVSSDAGVSVNDISDYTLTQPIITNVMVNSIEANLENGMTVISQNYYDLSTKLNEIAIIYQRVDNDICDCCNRSFSTWFSVNTYVVGMVYNLIDNYNSVTNQGYKIDFIDGILKINFFGQLYETNIRISPKNWYGLIINFNQKQALVEVFLYKRKGLCNTNDLELLTEISYPLKPVSYKGDLVLKLRGSNLYITNIRLWDEIIYKSEHTRILSSYVIKNNSNLILSDCAVPTIYFQNTFKY